MTVWAAEGKVVTEEEWLTSATPQEMVRYLLGRVSNRKLRLSVCACCRLEWGRFTDERCRRAIEAAEESADAPTPGAVLTQVLAGAQAAYEEVYYHGPAGSDYTPAQAAWCLASEADSDVMSWLKVGPAAGPIVRDVVGNPFQPVAFDPEWITSTAVALAQGIYASRAFDRLPILADALQDAGCDSEEVLTHCRDAGPHVRGCWVVDLLLGKK
jgi:hypothetical protein